MTKITVAFLRMVLKQYDNEEISYSKMVEFLNNEANKDNEALKFIKRLREGGEIVSSGSLSTLSIAQAQACNRFFVDEDYFGYAYFPKQKDVNEPASSNSEHLLNIPCVSVQLPTVKEVRSKANEYANEEWANDFTGTLIGYAKKDFIEGAEWMRTKAVGN